jgi:hypothetical protein
MRKKMKDETFHKDGNPEKILRLIEVAKRLN